MRKKREEKLLPLPTRLADALVQTFEDIDRMKAAHNAQDYDERRNVLTSLDSPRRL